MLREASQAPGIIAQQREHNRQAILRIVRKIIEIDPPVVLTCARGSSDHAATYAKYLIETRLGVPVCSFAPSVASLYHADLKLKRTLFIAISQSGQSPDLLSAAARAQKAGAYVVAIVNDEQSPLAACADDVVPICAGAEKSVAATKSCLGSMSAIFDLCATWRNDENMKADLDALPIQMAAALEADWNIALNRFVTVRQSLLISRGFNLSGVQEASLKLKETCRIQAEAFSAAEVKHGPMALVNEGFPIILASTFDAGQNGIEDVARLFVQRRAMVCISGVHIEGAITLPLPTASAPELQPLVFLQAFYRFANDLSVARGLDPDKPEHLKKVTETV